MYFCLHLFYFLSVKTQPLGKYVYIFYKIFRKMFCWSTEMLFTSQKYIKTKLLSFTLLYFINTIRWHKFPNLRKLKTDHNWFYWFVTNVLTHELHNLNFILKNTSWKYLFDKLIYPCLIKFSNFISNPSEEAEVNYLCWSHMISVLYFFEVVL